MAADTQPKRAAPPAQEGAVDRVWENARINRALQGDHAAYGELVERYAARICTHLYRLVGSREEAEDLAQETFLRTFRNLWRYDRSRPFHSWIYTIANNLGRNRLRDLGRRPQQVSLEDQWHWETENEGGTAENGRDLLIRGELAGRLEKAVGRLPGESAALIQLHYHEGMTIREAAKVMGIKESAARVRLHRARRALREWLIEDLEQ